MDWLEEELGSYDDDYLIIDCPGIILSCGMKSGVPDVCFFLFFFETGQIELYTHHPFLPTLVRNLQRLGIRTSAVYLLDAQFMEDKYKFFRSGSPSFCVQQDSVDIFYFIDPTVVCCQRCQPWLT